MHLLRHRELVSRGSMQGLHLRVQRLSIGSGQPQPEIALLYQVVKQLHRCRLAYNGGLELAA